jgi:hypothetical protein
MITFVNPKQKNQRAFLGGVFLPISTHMSFERYFSFTEVVSRHTGLLYRERVEHDWP